MLEAELVKEFCNYLTLNTAHTFHAATIHNQNGDTGNFADIELTTSSGELIAIEAKTHETRDAPNTVHKVFGQLLNEQRKKNEFRNAIHPSFAILIPSEVPDNPKAPRQTGKDYYQRRFQEIPTNHFHGFGVLVNAKYVFVFKRSEPQALHVYTWSGFYNNENPIV
ncbi:hypothetical protein [uncultured Deefgea sp.]|uniref:hypothetical protein n=1 Tax=uncultured Deefgea sp. TaxID=1304914 RepID=UPI00261B0F22|nr:hypothetical protein [uncultured Deefgea sp.]